LRLLLDTHIWLWSVREPARLGKRITRELIDPQNEVWLSPISVWEATLLIQKGRVRIDLELDEWVAQSTVNTREAFLTNEIVLAAAMLQLHPDPADRLLAATAKVLGLTLVTADQRLLGLADVSTMANR